MRVLSEPFVTRYADRMLNIHPSLLPSFRRTGHASNVRSRPAYARTARRCTSSVPVVDAGPIVAQAVVPVAVDDTIDTLSARVLAAEHRLFPQAVALVHRSARRRWSTTVVPCSTTSIAGDALMVCVDDVRLMSQVKMPHARRGAKAGGPRPSEDDARRTASREEDARPREGFSRQRHRLRGGTARRGPDVRHAGRQSRQPLLQGPSDAGPSRPRPDRRRASSRSCVASSNTRSSRRAAAAR